MKIERYLVEKYRYVEKYVTQKVIIDKWQNG